MISPTLQRGRRLLSALAAGLLALPAAASVLSFDEALRLAAREAPSLEAQAAKLEAARQIAVPAGELPDPKLLLGVQSLPIEQDNRWSLDDDAMTMQMVGLMQEVPNRDKRRARTEVARAGIEVAAAEERIEQLRVRLETARAWIATHSVERKLALFAELFEENRLLAAAVRARLAGGKGQALNAVEPRQEAARLAERQDELEEQRIRSRAALARWIGQAAQRPLAGGLPHWPLDAGNFARRLRQHPELEAYEPLRSEAQARIREAVAEKKPDWSWEVDYLRRGREFGDMVNLTLSVDLPLFAGSRQNPVIAARHAELDRLDAERQAVERAYAEQLAADLAERQRLARARQRNAESLLPLAREKVALAMAGYRTGKAELDAVLAARRELLEARLKQIDLEGLEAIASARLHLAYGETSE